MNLPRTHFLPEHEQFRSATRHFYQSEIGSRAGHSHEQDAHEQEGFHRAAFRKTGESGYLLRWAERQYGGVDNADFRYEQVLIEENARYGDPAFFRNAHSILAAPYIGRFGTHEQKLRYLPPAARGESIIALAVTERDAGDDISRMSAHAEDADDHWLLSGAKICIANGMLADVIIAAARTRPDGTGLFIVEADTQGFRRGRRHSLLGQYGQDTAEIFFDNVRVPKANVLGYPAQGSSYLDERLAIERLMCAIGAITQAQVAFDVTLDFVKQHKTSGTTLGALQHPRFVLAQLRSELDAVQCFVDECVMLANGARLTLEHASAAKLAASELQGRVLDACVQLHGSSGSIDDYPIGRMYAEARMSRIHAGSSESMKEIIGRGLGLGERTLQQRES